MAIAIHGVMVWHDWNFPPGKNSYRSTGSFAQPVPGSSSVFSETQPSHITKLYVKPASRSVVMVGVPLSREKKKKILH